MIIQPFSYKVETDEYFIGFNDIVKISRYLKDDSKKVDVHLKEIEFCEIENQDDIARFEIWLTKNKEHF